MWPWTATHGAWQTHERANPVVDSDDRGADVVGAPVLCAARTLRGHLIHANRFDSIQRRSSIEDRVSERHTATRGGRLFTRRGRRPRVQHERTDVTADRSPTPQTSTRRATS